MVDFLMTATVCIHINDKRLTEDERKAVLGIARKLYARDGGTATTTRTPTHPNALAASHWGRKPDGDL
jgi:hypothetical protein